MPKLTISDLDKIREQARGRRQLREGGPVRAKITVHMGTCGIAAGARSIMETFMEQIREGGVDDVQLANSGCAGLCSREPMATIECAGRPPVKYVELTDKKVGEIFNAHVMNGHPVEAYVLASGSERSI
jgi:NADP-reducing hydrogenase subunit HndB